MIRAASVIRDFEQATDTITLDETERHRRRVAMRSDNGIDFLLDLSEAQLLCDGDGLQLEDGRVIAVREKAEALYEVRARDAKHLVVLAWQIGNRHLPAEVHEDRIYIRRDHVIRDMLLGLGATVSDVKRAFAPEKGAYHSGMPDGHAHHHHHDHAHHHD